MIHTGDCLDVMAAMEPESVDAIVTDPPYGLEFMGKEWDRLGDVGKTSHSGVKDRDPSTPFGRTRVSYSGSSNVKCRACGKWQWAPIKTKCNCERPDFPSVKAHQGRLMERWHGEWAEAAYRVAKPSAYLLAFGGTRTVHRMTVALEDAGWIIRDMLVWAYASGFPKSKASLKPAWEPIVMARKPGPLRELAIDACRIPSESPTRAHPAQLNRSGVGTEMTGWPALSAEEMDRRMQAAYDRQETLGRWPANVLLTDPIFDGGVEGVVGGGETVSGARSGQYGGSASWSGEYGPVNRDIAGDSGTYSRFFLIPKADRADREPVLGGLSGLALGKLDNMGDWPNDAPSKSGGVNRRNLHPTVKPVDLMRHLVRLVTPPGGTVLDPFLGSGTTAIAAEMEGFPWIGIEREAEYVAIAEARLNGTQRGLGIA